MTNKKLSAYSLIIFVITNLHFVMVSNKIELFYEA